MYRTTELVFLDPWLSPARLEVGDFTGVSEANERDLSLIDHHIFMLQVVVGVTRRVNVFNYLKQLAAYVQNCI